MAIYKDLESFDKELYDKESIDNSIKNILLTKKGSVPGKPEFGADIEKYLFDTLDHIIVDHLFNIISENLIRFEPRISLEDININTQPEFNRIIITIQYKYTFIRNFDIQKTKIIINQ